jgi:LysR family transcriptional regulator, hydrogen peroxide-inducible genes activator
MKDFLLIFIKDHPLTKKDILSPKELDINEVLIMAEGHCFKNQTLELCRLKKSAKAPKIHFESNNFQTLINLVDKRMAISLLPELILQSLSSSQRKIKDLLRIHHQ